MSLYEGGKEDSLDNKNLRGRVPFQRSTGVVSISSRHRTTQNTKEKVFLYVSLYSLVETCPNIPTFRRYKGMLYNRTDCFIICIIVKSIQNGVPSCTYYKKLMDL